MCFLTGDRCKRETDRDALPQLSPRGGEVLEVWRAAQTQWRHGWNGPTGLDYASVRDAAELLGLPLGAEEFRLIQVMEEAWLRAMDEARKKAEVTS